MFERFMRGKSADAQGKGSGHERSKVRAAISVVDSAEEGEGVVDAISGNQV